MYGLDVESTFITVNGIRHHVVQAGPKDGPLVILLHGFPEFWYGWRHQIPALAAAGYRVWAPDQQGYNLSDKPSDIAAYRLDKLANNVVGLIQAAGEEQAVVVGHDWGAAVAWYLAASQPQVVRKLVTMNVPHNAVFRRFLTENWRQRLRSSYMFFFQIPRLPEWMLALNKGAPMADAMKGVGLPTSFTKAELAIYREMWAQPGTYQAMLNWYRASIQKRTPRLASQRITMPTLLLWGMKDRVLSSEMAQPSIELCDNGRLVLLPSASHWVQHDAAEEVTSHLLDFLR